MRAREEEARKRRSNLKGWGARHRARTAGWASVPRERAYCPAVAQPALAAPPATGWGVEGGAMK